MLTRSYWVVNLQKSHNPYLNKSTRHDKNTTNSPVVHKVEGTTDGPVVHMVKGTTIAQQFTWWEVLPIAHCLVVHMVEGSSKR